MTWFGWWFQKWVQDSTLVSATAKPCGLERMASLLCGSGPSIIRWELLTGLSWGAHRIMHVNSCEQFLAHRKFLRNTIYCCDFAGGSDGKESMCNAGDVGSMPRSGRSSGAGNGYPILNTPVLLPGESHGQRSLVSYSPWGHRESDAAQQRTLSLSLLWLSLSLGRNDQNFPWTLMWVKQGQVGCVFLQKVYNLCNKQNQGILLCGERVSLAPYFQQRKMHVAITGQRVLDLACALSDGESPSHS